MTASDIALKVRQVISDVLGIPIEKVQEDASLASDLAADSLDAVEVVMELEEAFQVVLSNFDRSTVQTVSGLILHITRALNADLVPS